ncbi:Uncharacterized protein TCM_036527 [Theobroma cacao]|uniref:Uncharacterized protein n=1 Tax=Theobroma cacao TaxID=3641 RepID=A0A061FKE3_THECC|nr:Uncharacterized protein TCM_036527 [Theobroma cacao]
MFLASSQNAVDCNVKLISFACFLVNYSPKQLALFRYLVPVVPSFFYTKERGEFVTYFPELICSFSFIVPFFFCLFLPPLSTLCLGFEEGDARRALRLNNQDIGSAVDFPFDEKTKRAVKREDEIRRRMEIVSGAKITWSDAVEEGRES